MEHSVEFPSGPFDVIYADPPWYYYGDPNKMAAAGKHYRLMSPTEIASLPVGDLAHDCSVLFLWATSAYIDVAIHVMRVWGFHFRGVQFVWVKTRKDGGVIRGMGVRPSIVKPTCEFVVAGSKQERGRPLPLADESVGQVILAPRREHSRKPDEVYESIEALYPNHHYTKIELFARYPRESWVAWGDEVPV